MDRRAFLLVTMAAALPAWAQAKPMKIGVIGSGRIGSTIGGLWVKAGHEVMFSDRDAPPDAFEQRGALRAAAGQSRPGRCCSAP